MATTASIKAPETPRALLAAVRDRHAAAVCAEIEKFRLAAQWAAMYPVESLDSAATVDGSEGELAIAGPGAPLVAEFCVAELAAALGLSSDAGRTYLGDAVEVRYRLPKIWARVLAGQVPVWKARRIAQATKSLPPAAAAFVDTHLAPVAGTCSFAQLDRTIEEARVRYDPVEAEHRRLLAAETRRFDVETAQVSFDGTVRVEGELDLADALDLDAAVAAGARQLGELGCSEPLDVRRSMAAGQLARNQLALDLSAEPDVASAETPIPTRRPVKTRQVILYVHLSADAVAGLASADAVAGLENTRSPVSAEQVRTWCGNADVQLTVRPVIDLNAHRATDRRNPSRVMREQAVLTHPTCVFPHCTRPSRRCDLDHTVPSERGGTTDSWNLAPLCRFHHRVKTHGGWSYVRTAPRSFTWTSPHGLVLHVGPADCDGPPRHIR
jgi:hypothetical protein